MAEWKKYTGSEEQLKEMKSAAHGYIVRFNDGLECDVRCEGLTSFMQSKTTHYLICEPHKHADMIKRWADTGQPVYCKFLKVWVEFSNDLIWDDRDFEKFSFTPPEYTIKYRDYLCKDSVGRGFKETLNKIDKTTPAMIEDRDSFIRWIHEDWQELEID